MPELSVGVVLLVASASAFGPLSGWLAVQRRRNAALWLIFGIVLGPIASVLLLSAPPGRCAACRWPVAGWSAECVACGADVRTGATVAPVGHLVQAPAHLTLAGVGVPSSAATAAASGGNGRLSRSTRAGGRQSSERASTASTGAARSVTGAVGSDLAAGRLLSGVGLPEPASLPASGESPSAGSSVPRPPALEPVEPWSPRAPATGLGQRPVSATARHLTALPADSAPEPTGAIQIVGSAVYMGGNRPMETGYRYLLARVGPELQILGPTHLDAGHVADRLPVSDIEIFFLDGRLLIGSRNASKEVMMAFVAVSLDRGVDLEAIFGPATYPAATSARG